jgi:hypothetical protein
LPVVLLILPPAVKACEPPAGLARLAGALTRHHLPCDLLDANLEALLHRLKAPVSDDDPWTRRAVRHRDEHLGSLWSGRAFANPDRYARAVNDLNRVLQKARPGFDGTMTLSNYQDHHLSPVRSADLLRAAAHPEENPFFDYFSPRLDGLLRERPYSLIGFSVNYLSQALCALAMVGYLRKRAPEVKIILGGGLITSWMCLPGWSNPFGGLVDELVAGPGEGAVLKYCGITAPEDRYLPDYRALAGGAYLSPGFILPYSTSSGCYWSRCAFCPERAEGRPFRPLPHSRVRADLTELFARTRPVLLHIVDNAVSPAVLKALAEHPLPVPWYGFVRFSRELADPDFCLALKRSGCVLLKLGLESGDQEVLDRMGKGVDLAEASKVLRNLKAAGIAAYVYLLFGTPAEDLSRARKTLDYVIAHSREIGFLNLAIFNLPRNSPEAGGLETDEFYEGDLSLYRRFRHPLGWDRPLVRHFLDREFKRHPAVAAVLRRDPPFFTSNHAPFFEMRDS